MGYLESEVYMVTITFSKCATISRLVDYLNSVKVSPDKHVYFYCGAESDFRPAVEIWDEYTNEICLWWGKITHERFRTMYSEVRTDYRK